MFKKSDVISIKYRNKDMRSLKHEEDYELMAEELSAAFEKAGYDPSYGKVTVSNRPDLCEYQCNGAMAGAKAYHKAPFMIADDVVHNRYGRQHLRKGDPYVSPFPEIPPGSLF